jgi:hypothetical protein
MICQYLRNARIGKANSLQVVDWHQGKVAVGGDESEILKLLKSIPNETK